MEIIQPDHLSIPNRGDPERWGRMPIIYEEWVRYVFPQLNYSGERINEFLLGHVVETILDDDGNCFPKGGQNEDWYYEVVHGMQRHLTTRLEWEINSDVLPEDITLKLNELLDYVNANDWEVYENMLESSVLWRYIRMELESRIYPGGDLETVYRAFQRDKKLAQDSWADFINGL